MNTFGEKVSFIWSVADLLRGPYKPAQYGDVMLPLTVLRRLDCVLAPTRDKVQAKIQDLRGSKVENLEPILNRAAGQKFHNRSRLDFQKLKGEPDKIAQNLTSYIKGFSSSARNIIEHFGFEQHIERLEKHNRLYLPRTLLGKRLNRRCCAKYVSTLDIQFLLGDSNRGMLG
jgi:type I restriction enzyme M protein